MPQLLKKIIISGEIEAVTGLLIGASQSGMTIGGTDKQVIRDPVSQKPYIPGSSLKGKMRSLIELRDGTFGTIPTPFGPSSSPSAPSAQLFGFVKNESGTGEKQQPSRLIVRDAHLLNADKLAKTELLYTEAKTENGINRITSEANPRTFERVPAGAVFGLNLVLNVFDTDAANKTTPQDTLFEALRLVQDDYLGGGGSRGNGQVKFRLKKAVERDADTYRTGSDGRDVSDLIPADLR